MSHYQKLTRHDGVSITVNMARVRYFHPNGDKTQLYFAKDDILAVRDSYQQIIEAIQSADD